MRNEKPFVLLVDDDPIIGKLVETLLNEEFYHFVFIEKSSEALSFIRKHHDDLDVILLDRQMPEVNGLEIAKILRQDPCLQHIPVVMQTSSNGEEEIKEGIDVSVYYYLIKPLNTEIFMSILKSAIKERIKRRSLQQELSKFGSGFSLMNLGNFKFNSIQEAETLSVFLASCFPDRDKAAMGLSALLVNAVEHGNLGIGYETKGSLLKEDLWIQEIQKRSELKENINKNVSVTFRQEEKGLFIRIQDQGDGFDWKKYLHIDPSRSFDNHGRGIAQANNISFESLTYNEKGNEVTAFVSFDKPLDW